MATALRLPELRTDIEHAIEIVPPRWIDDDEILELGSRYEMLTIERFADGSLLVSPLPGWMTSSRNGYLFAQIFAWTQSNAAGLCLGPDGDVVFPDRSLLRPDATFISRERWKTADRVRTLAHTVPDAVFELLSKSARIASTRRKMQTYLRNGVALAVLIDCERRHVYVGRDGEADTRDLGWVDRLDCAPAMPGLVLDLAAVCAASDVVREDPGQDDRGGEGTGGHPPQT